MNCGTPARARIAGLAAALLLGGAAADAATPFTEGFAGGLSGWTNNGNIAWTSVANVAKAVVPSTPLLPPNKAYLLAGAGASGGAFLGDYAATGLTLLGFSFRADGGLPGLLELRLRGSTNTFIREFTNQVVQTGVWYHFAISLQSQAEGRWNSGATEEDFQQALLDVNNVSLQVGGRSDVAITCYLDDFFVDRHPEAARLQATTNGYGDITWNYIHSNFTYRLEFADSLTGTWSNAAQVTATSTGLTSNVALTNSATRLYRLLLP